MLLIFIYNSYLLTLTLSGAINTEITSLLTALSSPTITLRLSSTVFAHSDDNLSLCTFASKDYNGGVFAPRLLVGASSGSSSQGSSSSSSQGSTSSQEQGSSSSQASSNQEEPKMNMLSSNLVGLPQDQEVVSPYKLFPPKEIQPLTATTSQVTQCAAPYSPHAIYAHNSVVSSQNSNYRCKGHPYTVWCSEEEYEPGVSLFWGMAWELVNGMFVLFVVC